MKRHVGMALVLGLAVSAVACSDSSGVHDTAPVSVSMQITGSALASSGFDGTALLSMGGISASEVDSLFVEVTGLAFLSCDSDCVNDPDPDPDPSSDPDPDPDQDECCGYWTHLPLDESVVINLMALPTEDDSVFVFAEGELPIGEYQKIRIYVGDASVWFNTDQSKGKAEFLPDTEYTVTVPSGRLNTNVGLTIEDDGAGAPVPVSLVFDPAMTFQNVHTTGSGKVILTPQFRLR
jgi:hypothetical protein